VILNGDTPQFLPKRCLTLFEAPPIKKRKLRKSHGISFLALPNHHSEEPCGIAVGDLTSRFLDYVIFV
jgi:hypothetical protein